MKDNACKTLYVFYLIKLLNSPWVVDRSCETVKR